jgi:hypothetical protein
MSSVNIQFKLFLAAAFFSFPTIAFSLQLGEIVSAGAGCFGSGRVVAISGQEGRYAIPLRVRVNKKADAAFDRKSCQVRIPVTLAPNEKLQLIEASQVVRVISQKDADIKTNLTLGLVGRGTKTVGTQLKVTEDETSYIENVKTEGIISESGCGQSTMLMGNLNAMVTGANAQTFVSTGAMLLTLRTVSCE